MHYFHDFPIRAHMGKQKKDLKIRKESFWPNMYSVIEEYVRSCHDSQCAKQPQKFKVGTYSLQNIRVYSDVFGSLLHSSKGNICLFILIDFFFTFVVLIPLGDRGMSEM
ncbi:hypothetical protein PR048_002719 [Dryococelus australis]|uniref:Integrase zinc-binding domain-containing protein n=1 Tax=Dryococelus australis TaxID=614101 RepID=A0ABQ9IKY8_9NEOP|nr:hypothetical protein PR048_002719 [Dryococelus australis]